MKREMRDRKSRGEDGRQMKGIKGEGRSEKGRQEDGVWSAERKEEARKRVKKRGVESCVLQKKGSEQFRKEGKEERV